MKMITFILEHRKGLEIPTFNSGHSLQTSVCCKAIVIIINDMLYYGNFKPMYQSGF